MFQNSKINCYNEHMETEVTTTENKEKLAATSVYSAVYRWFRLNLNFEILAFFFALAGTTVVMLYGITPLTLVGLATSTLAIVLAGLVYEQ